jgi:hypothetical protein
MLIEIGVQVDMGKTLAPQIWEIVARTLAQVGNNPYNVDIIIPPGLSVVAAQLVRHFPGANLAVIARVGDAVPPVYDWTGELLRPVRREEIHA